LLWPFLDPSKLLTLPQQISALQVGYCLARHGVPDAINFMNQCAENDAVIGHISAWNLPHAQRNVDELLAKLKEKAETHDANLLPFHKWHKRVYEGTLKMTEEPYLKKVLRQ